MCLFFYLILNKNLMFNNIKLFAFKIFLFILNIKK